MNEIYQVLVKKANSGDKYDTYPLNSMIYLPAGFSGAGAGAGASAGFSGAGAGAVAGAAAGFGASGFGVSAGLQPKVNATNNINDNINAITFLIKFSPPSRIT